MPLSIMEKVLQFFDSPMWVDTIKDFVLANCYIFTGEEEFSHEHNTCHQEFCQIIENTLNIYLLDIIGVSFEAFQKACVDSAANKNSVGAKVLSVLKQATDFRYFAAKMYAYNLMLDREAATSFVVTGPGEDAFFVTSGAAEQEAKHAEDMVNVATSDLNKVEEELGLPPSLPVFDDSKPPLEEEKPVEAPKPVVKEEKKEEPVKHVSPLTTMPQISEAEKAAIRLKIQREKEALAKTVSEEEMQRRKEMFQKRREELIAQKRTVCKDNIELNIKKMEKPVPIAKEDPDEALKRALAKRVKTIIEE